jgi:hypothetical protein
MFRSIIAFMEKWPDVWNTHIPVVPIVNNVKSVIAGMELHMRNEMEKDRSGDRQEKSVRFDVLLRLTYKLLTKLRAFARASQNSTLFSAVDYSPSSLESGSDVEMISRCRMILTKGREYFTQTADYDITFAELNAIAKALDDAAPFATQGNSMDNDRRAASTGIRELIRKGQEQLTILDDLIGGMVSDKEFITAYYHVRCFLNTPMPDVVSVEII